MKYLIFLLFLILVSYGEALRSPSDDPLLGIWNSPCYIEDGDDEYSIEQIELSQTDMIKRRFYYSDSECSSPLYVTSFESRLFEYGLSSRIFEARKFIYIIENEKSIFQPLTQEGENKMNIFNFCGINSWSLNNTKELLREDCFNKNTFPLKVFPYGFNSREYIQLFHLEEGLLRVADETCLVENRCARDGDGHLSPSTLRDLVFRRN